MGNSKSGCWWKTPGSEAVRAQSTGRLYLRSPMPKLESSVTPLCASRSNSSGGLARKGERQARGRSEPRC